jgi:predicted anti-sigma-YlaC factor YlaD
MAEDWGFVDNELRITCADAIELVTDFLDDALSRDDLVNFEAHLSLCEGCRAYLDQVRRTITITTESRDHMVELTPANFDLLLDMFTRQPNDDGG